MNTEYTQTLPAPLEPGVEAIQRSAHFLRAPLPHEMTPASIAVATFSSGALQAALRHNDPIEYRFMDSILTDEQWSALTEAVNSSSGVTFDSTSCPSASRIQAIVLTVEQSWYSDWLIKLHVLLNSTCRQGIRRPFSLDVTDPVRRTGNLSISMSRIVQWLYSANRIVEHMECLASVSSTRRVTLQDSLFTADELNALFSLYESLRPAANFWRSVPWGALTHFEELACIEVKCESMSAQHLFKLDLALSSKAWRIKLNPSYSNDAVQAWWKSWTSSEFQTAAHLRVNTFDTLDTLRRMRDHIGSVADAFDITNSASVAVLERLDAYSLGSTLIMPELPVISGLLHDSHDHLVTLVDEVTGFIPSFVNAPRPLRRPEYEAPAMLPLRGVEKFRSPSPPSEFDLLI